MKIKIKKSYLLQQRKEIINNRENKLIEFILLYLYIKPGVTGLKVCRAR